MPLPPPPGSHAFLHTDPHGQDFDVTWDTDKVFYTVYMRMIAEWMHSDAGSREDLSVALRPSPSGLFDLPANGTFSPDRFTELDVGSLREMDDIIGDYQDCQDGVAAHDFQTCSDDFLGVYDQVREDTDDYNRVDAPVLIHPGSALVWEGLGASHYLHPSIPAWSSARRAEREVFARHVLDGAERCKEGRSEHAVCSKPEEGAKLRSINPWLGGQWNPYESCDTRHRMLAGRETLQV